MMNSIPKTPRTEIAWIQKDFLEKESQFLACSGFFTSFWADRKYPILERMAEINAVMMRMWPILPAQRCSPMYEISFKNLLF